jgi:hypothetical protein
VRASRDSFPVFGAVAGLLAVSAGAGIIGAPVLTLAVIGVVAFVLLLALRPLWLVHITLFLAITTLPAAVPYSLAIGSKSLFLFEPLVYICALYVVSRFRPPPAAVGSACLLVGFAVYGFVSGYVRGYPRDVVISEARPHVACAAVLLTAGCLIGSEHARSLLITLRWSLWTSAVFTVVGSVTGLPLNGRIETAGLFINGQETTSDALRLLTPASHVADAVLCVCVALLITGRVKIRPLVPYLVPALVISLLGFSRNTLLAVGVAVVVALVATRSTRILAGLLRIVGVAVAGAAVVALLVTARLPGHDWVQRQGDAFQSRVIAGAFDSQVRSLDASALARQVEDGYADAAIATAPLGGHGFGYAYRPAFGPPVTFTARVGPYYVHDFYRWVWVKTGIVGLTLWALIVVPPFVRRIVRPSPRGTAFAAATAGLFVVCLVAPLPTGIDDGGAVTIGIVLGGLCAAEATRRSPAALLHGRSKGHPPEEAGRPAAAASPERASASRH